MAEMVTVRMNMPWDMTFDVMIKGVEKKILINGAKKKDGAAKIMLPEGEYGVTTIAKEEWDAIEKTWGSMDMFKNNLIFAMKDKNSAADKAEDLKEKRHGLEQKDPVKTKTKGSK